MSIKGNVFLFAPPLCLASGSDHKNAHQKFGLCFRGNWSQAELHFQWNPPKLAGGGGFPLGRDAPEVGTVPAAANRQQRPQQPVKRSQHGGLG